ncbi:MAG: glycosyltransferase family 4 protein [Bacteroidales bacterium]
MPASSKILIITYYWPPCGGAGVQRWLKFSKYLPENGWEPVILTVDPEYASFPAFDTSLLNEIAHGTRVEKTRAVNYFAINQGAKNKNQSVSGGFATGKTGGLPGIIARFVRGNFFIPDPRRGWNRYAIKKAIALISDLNIEYVITTSPPHSTQLIGLKLKKRFPSIKWIADFRDPWTDIYYYRMFLHSFLAKAIDARYEKIVLKKADLILTVGESLAKLFESKVGNIGEKVRVVYNGYDESDFEEIKSERSDGQFIITYVGTISDLYPIEGFLHAVNSLIKSSGTFIKVRFVGNISGRHLAKAIEALGKDHFEHVPYVEHTDSIQYMVNSNLLLLVIPDHPQNELIVTGKLFEYLRSGSPVMCLCSPGNEASGIIEQVGAGQSFNYNDTEGMMVYLNQVINHGSSYEVPSRFSRKEITKQLLNNFA